jgi:hypothetical protein
MIDPGVLGGLIGVGFMACIVVSSCCYEKRKQVQNYWKKRRHLHQPLLPVIVVNPTFVRSGSKQWKIKELVASK